MDRQTGTDAAAPKGGTAAEVFGVFLKLGLTSFGGPVAHLGYFREELVQRRRWLSDQAYGDLVALCQFLPGPASSQAGFALGLMRAGWAGALAAFVGFTLPSALALVAVALAGVWDGPLGTGAVHGLKLVAVAVVAQAVLGMARSLCPDRERAALAVGAVALLALVPGVWAMPLAIAAGAVAGLALTGGAAAGAAGAAGPAGGPTGGPTGAPEAPLAVQVPVRVGIVALGLFGALLVALPLLAGFGPGFAVADAFYRAGALVFGGGHVVLPLLQAEVVAPGWVTTDQFLTGYAAAQAVPGPLFTFAAYLGAVLQPGPSGVAGAALALGAVFLPGFLILIGVLPFWDRARSHPAARAAMQGANAAVVGVLGAALYDPVFTGSVGNLGDLALALACFVALTAWRVPVWAVVLAGAAGGVALTL